MLSFCIKAVKYSSALTARTSPVWQGTLVKENFLLCQCYVGGTNVSSGEHLTGVGDGETSVLKITWRYWICWCEFFWLLFFFKNKVFEDNYKEYWNNLSLAKAWKRKHRHCMYFHFCSWQLLHLEEKKNINWGNKIIELILLWFGGTWYFIFWSAGFSLWDPSPSMGPLNFFSKAWYMDFFLLLKNWAFVG